MPKAREKSDKKPARKRVSRKKPRGQAIGLSALEIPAPSPPPSVLELERQIAADGGAVLCSYREPYGGHWLLVAGLPLDRVEPTPYQRDLSEPHRDRLADVITRIGRFLDPIVAVRAGDGRYWTPNGSHRLSAMKALGARSIPALVIPEKSAAYQILALNTEKAHNLREKALEVVRMYRELARLDGRTEEDYGLEFEEPALLTLGLCYEARPRFAGGAYHPVLKRTDRFLKLSLHRSIEKRRAFSESLLAVDDAVNGIVKSLKSKGFASPYLKAFVVARINPVRFKPRGSELPDPAAVLEKMLASAKKFDVSRIRAQDLAGASGPPEAS